MQGATHFIEIWSSENAQYAERIKKIIYKKRTLEATKAYGFKTIAVWNIKLKTN